MPKVNEKIKVGGHWKDITMSYVKANGKWEGVLGTSLKVNGKWVDINSLPATEPEQYSYHTPPKKTGTALLLEDAGKYPKKPAFLMSCNHLACTTKERLSLPILHDAGSVLPIDSVKVSDTTSKAITGGYEFTSTGYKPTVWLAPNTKTVNTDTKMVTFKFHFHMKSGKTYPTITSYIRNVNGTPKAVDLDIPIQVKEGVNTILAYTWEGKTQAPYLVFKTLQEAFVWEITAVEVKLPTIPPTSFIAAYDPIAKEFKQLPTPTDNITYSMVTPFSHYFAHNKAPSQADYGALNANPNLIADVWFNGAVLPSGFKKSDIVAYIPANEGKGICVQDLSKPAPTELSTNNTFDTDLSGWKENSTGVSSWSNGTIEIKQGTANHAYQNIKVVKGNSYLFGVDVLDKAFSFLIFGGAYPVYPFSEVGRMEAIVTADTTGEVKFGFGINGGTHPAKFDNFSCVEITSDSSLIPIASATTASRKQYRNVSFGVQNFFLEQDVVTGRITASHDDKALRGGNDGRYLNIDGSKQLITKSCVTDVKGDTIGQLTETECKP